MARTIADHGEKAVDPATAVSQRRDNTASMTEVAKTGGISKANIYHYYASKDALLFDILDAYLSSLRRRILELPLSGLDDTDKLLRILEEFLLAYEGMDHEHKIQIEGLPLLPLNQQEILKRYQRDMVASFQAFCRTLSQRIFPETNAHYAMSQCRLC